MKRSVIKSCLEIDAREACQYAFLGRFDNPFFNRRDVGFGDCPPDNGVDKFKTLSPGQRLELHPAVTKLAVTASLFFVAPLDPHFFLDGFAVGYFGGVQDNFDIELTLQLLDRRRRDQEGASLGCAAGNSRCARVESLRLCPHMVAT